MSSKKTPIELRADEILRQLDEGEVAVLPRAGEIVIGNWLNIFTQRREDETLADALSQAVSSYRAEGGERNARTLDAIWERARAYACLRIRIDYESPLVPKAPSTKRNDSAEGLDILYDTLIRNPTIRRHTESRFKSKQYSDAIFAAFKAVNNLVKVKTGIENDGVPLMGEAFNSKKPRLKLNALKTDSDIDEQAGFMMLYQGAYLGIRNPKAHDTVEQKDPIRTLHYLALADLLATRVDEAKLV